MSRRDDRAAELDWGAPAAAPARTCSSGDARRLLSGTTQALMWLRTQRRRGELPASGFEAEIGALADAAPEPAEA